MEMGSRHRDQRLHWGCVGLLLLLLSPSDGTAHGTYSGRLARIEAHLEHEPSRSELYLARAELHRDHDRLDEALRDIERASALSPEAIEIELALARVDLDRGRFASARDRLNRYLTARPADASGRVLRARALLALDRPLEAATDLSQAISLQETPTPELYVLRARALSEAGPERFEEAIRGLDEGLTRLGPVTVLVLRAIDLEVERGEFDAALDRLDRLIARVEASGGRQEGWLVRRGDILVRSAREETARADYERALALMGELSPRRRGSPAIRALRTRAQEALRILGPSLLAREDNIR